MRLVVSVGLRIRTSIPVLCLDSVTCPTVLSIGLWLQRLGLRLWAQTRRLWWVLLMTWLMVLCVVVSELTLWVLLCVVPLSVSCCGGLVSGVSVSCTAWRGTLVLLQGLFLVVKLKCVQKGLVVIRDDRSILWVLCRCVALTRECRTDVLMFWLC